MQPLMIIMSIVLILVTNPLIAGETVSDPQLGLSLSVPDGFVKAPDKIHGSVIFAFQRPPADNQKVGTFILVSRLGGVLDRNKIDPKEIAAKSPQVMIVTEKWKEFDIEVFRVPEQAGDLQLVTFNAQVPLKPEAVQVAVIGEAARENELRSVLRVVLGSLDGQTNWLNTQQRVSKFAEGITRLVITAVVLVVIVVVVWQAVRKRTSKRGTAEPNPVPDRPRD